MPSKPMKNSQLKVKKTTPRWLLFSTPFLIFNFAFLIPSLAPSPNSLVPPAFAQIPASRKAEANRLNELGIQQCQTGQCEAALQSFQEALRLYRTLKDRRGEENALGNLGVAYRTLGNYSKTIEYQQQSLEIAREIKDRLGEGNALGNLGNAYYSLGNYGKAIGYQQQRLEIAREIKDRLGEGNALGNLGLAYDALGNYGKAIEYQQQRLEIAREIKDRRGEGAALGNLGITYRTLGNYGKAMEYYQQSLEIARKIKDRRSEGAALGNLGIAYDVLGNYDKAIEYQQQSLAITQEIKDRRGEGTALGNLGLAYFSLGNYGKAIEYQQQGLAIIQEIKDRRSEGAALGNLGNAYQALGNYAKGIEYQQQSLAIMREIKDRLGEGTTLGGLGSAYYTLGNYGKAIQYYQQHLAIAREIKDHHGEGNALGNLGLAFFKSGRIIEAEAPLQSAIQVRESLRVGLKDSEKVSIFDTQRNPYNNLQRVLIAQNKSEAALKIAERGRARAFVELLAKRLNSQQPTTKNQQLSIQPPTIQQIKQIAKDHNATLVEYSVIWDEALYIWVVKPIGDMAFRQVNLQPTRSTPTPKPAPTAQTTRSAFSDPVNALRSSIRGIGAVPKDPAASPSGKPLAFSADPRLIKIQLRNLHQQLIEPIADLLPSDPNQHLIFVPQGELFLVPFAALEDSSGKALIEKHTILTAPSIQVLELTRKERSVDAAAASRRVQRGVRSGNSDSLLLSPLSSLIVGNPTMPKIVILPGEPAEQLPPLPGAKKEAEAIAQFLNTSFLTGNQATKATVKQRMPGAKLIHLATHGLLDERNGIQSAIALAPSGQDNGLLTADEILDLSLQAELVVLSACDSGRGKLTGDGVIGLSRSLISAGVPSVIVSLWSVPDAPTAELMTEFYRQLKQNPDKAQALRQAMLKTKAKYPNPTAWAAFTLIGEAE